MYLLISHANNGSSEVTVCKLSDLAKNSVLLVEDVLAYRRNFPALNLTIEKDVLVRMSSLLVSAYF